MLIRTLAEAREAIVDYEVKIAEMGAKMAGAIQVLRKNQGTIRALEDVIDAYQAVIETLKTDATWGAETNAALIRLSEVLQRGRKEIDGYAP